MVEVKTMLSIEQRQRSLFYCGFYYTGKIDKIEGTLTKKAYGLFQKDHGLEVDSIYGPITDRMLIEAVKSLHLEKTENTCWCIVRTHEYFSGNMTETSKYGYRDYVPDICIVEIEREEIFKDKIIGYLDK